MMDISNTTLQKIVSGGQTGVDRAALDAAIQANIKHGGWCPKNRLDENGKIPGKYSNLREVCGEFKNDKENYETRTKQNVIDSDATLIIVPLAAKIQGGTLFTLEEAKNQNKLYLIIDLSVPKETVAKLILNWIHGNSIGTLNIAGPRESTCPGIYKSCLELLGIVLSHYIA